MQVEELIGSFASMVMLLTDLSGEPTLGEVLRRVRETTLGAFAHQEMPFFLLLANFPPTDFNYDRSPFQVSFTLHNAPRAALDFAEITASSGDGIDRGTADLDLALAAIEDDDGLHLVLRYDQDLFERTTIQDLLTELGHILQQLVDAPETRM